MKKKVLYIIYASHPKSGGGHYHSLLTLVNSLKSHIDFKILNVGLTHAKVLQGNIVSDYVHLNKLNYFFKMPSIINYVKSFNPDVIHAFDYNALNVARTLQSTLKIPVVLSKCGGENGSNVIPFADAYVCFSEENKRHMEKYKKNDIPIKLLPNRATTVKPDLGRINVLKQKYELSGKFVMMRISRFETQHELSILQAINLFKFLYKKNENAVLLIIGIQQTESTLNNVQKASEGFPIHIINDSYYTKNASELLGAADLIVATGRGTMEAASLGKPIFCPLKDGDLPAPLNEENFEKMSEYNFSGRITGVSLTEEKINSYLNRDLDELRGFIIGIFNTKFNIDHVVPDYLRIYETVTYTKPTVKSVVNYVSVILRFFKPKFLAKRNLKLKG